MSFKHQLFEMLRELEESDGGSREGSEAERDPLSELSYRREVSYNGREWRYYLITSERDCDVIIPYLERAERYYIDTEFQGFRQDIILSLLQISVGDELFVIDCYQMGAYEPLAACLSRPEVEWVLHDARTDIQLLCQFFEIPCPERVLDTQVAWGFQHTLGQIGLALLSHVKLNLHVDKSFQAAQFLKRPLPAEWVEYAALDLPPLIALTERFVDELPPSHLEGARAHSLERVWLATPHLKPQPLDETTEEVDRAPTRIPGLTCPLSATPQDPRFFDDLERFSFHLWSLSPPQLQCLRFLKEWRAEAAPDHPIHDGFPYEKQWLRIARCSPLSLEGLRELQGLNAYWLDAYGSSLVVKLNEVIAQVPSEWSDHPDSEWPVTLRPPPVLMDRSEPQMLKLWFESIVLRCARKLSIAPDYLIPSQTIKKIKWPDEWSTQDKMPPLEEIWAHISEALPMIHEGWRRELLSELLRDTILGYTSPLRI